MLPEIGATELMVIAAVALIVVGPKDLPMLLRKLGGFVARLRGMASEFRNSFDDMARQSELEDLRKEVAAMRHSAAAESSEVNSTLADMNKTLHDDITLAELRETPAVDPDAFDPTYQLYGEEAQPLTPADVAPKPAKAPRAPRQKTTISKVAPPAAEVAEIAPVAKPKAAKPRAPRKIVT
jgi:sec-independent protein translocase protein TatB